MPNFTEMYDSLFEGKMDVKFKTDKIKGHSHLGVTDENGNGKTIKVVGAGQTHDHKVVKNEMQPALSHVHKIQDMNEGSTENALGTLKAIIGSLKGRNDATGKDMFKMAVGIKDYYDKEKSFSPDQASWIFKMSKMFKESADMTDAQFKKLMKDIRKKAAELEKLKKQYRDQTGRDLRV